MNHQKLLKEILDNNGLINLTNKTKEEIKYIIIQISLRTKYWKIDKNVLRFKILSRL